MATPRTRRPATRKRAAAAPAEPPSAPEAPSERSDDAGRLPAVKVSRSVPAGATAVAVWAASDRLNRVPGVRKAALDRAGFSGAVGTAASFDDGERTRVVLGLGASDAVGARELRRAGAAFARAAARHRRVALELPAIGVDASDAVGALVEGLLLGSYRFDQLRSAAPDGPRTEAVTLVVDDAAEVRRVRPAVERAVAVAGAVCAARDLVNTPGGILTPEVFAERIAARAEAAGLDVEVLDEDAIRAARLGGLLAVNQGSANPPRLVRLTYEPPADATEGRDVPTVALVGKGITFDSGGLSIKPAESMMEMKSDMAGAAAVLSAACALPALAPPVRVVAYAPMTDNMTGGGAQRPGDVYTARNGTTVEVLNTDAEGRLVLAEALALASEEAPAAIVDVATLTGACMVALGDRIAGLMGNDDGFRARVAAAAEAAGERVWELPLPDDYRPRLDSQVADIKNIGGGRFGGALTAGLFLRDFVGDGIPWAHVDIAGPSFLSEPDGENPKGATGFGVRTLLALVESFADDPAEAADEADEAPVARG